MFAVQVLPEDLPQTEFEAECRFFGSPRESQTVVSCRGLGVAGSLDSQVTCHQSVSVTDVAS